MRRTFPWLLAAGALLTAASLFAQPGVRFAIALPASLAVPAAGAAAQAAGAAPQASVTAPTGAGKPAAAAAADISIPDEVVRGAMKSLGVPYVHGGDSRDGFDCSGLIYSLFRQATAQELPRSVDSLFRTGAEVTKPMHIGDLLFFDTVTQAAARVPTHVGVYIGAERFVHAASEGPRTGVIISTLQMPYYRERFLGVRRVITWRPPVLALRLTDDYKSLTTENPFPSREAMKICVYNEMSGGGPVDLTVLKDGGEVLSRRIVPGAQAPALVEITPDSGKWTVRVTRIWRGRELQNLSFRVEE